MSVKCNANITYLRFFYQCSHGHGIERSLPDVRFVGYACVVIDYACVVIDCSIRNAIRGTVSKLVSRAGFINNLFRNVSKNIGKFMSQLLTGILK